MMPSKLPVENGGRTFAALFIAALFIFVPTRAEGGSVQLGRFLQRARQEPSVIPRSTESEPIGPAKKPSEAFAGAAIIAPSLLKIADSRSFRSSGWKGRVERIQRWVRRNAIEHFRELDLKNRDLALIRVAKQLDDLLAEKDFRVPKVRKRDRVAMRERS